jgi:DNA-binding NtrC family response regulator
MRVIAASNVLLKDLLAQGQMRSDFYYRINVIPIQLVPLRERREDIPLLVSDFLRHHPVAKNKGITAVSQRGMSHLMQHSWPGNVRELQNVLERAIVLTSGRVIEKIDLPDALPPVQGDGKKSSHRLPLRQWLNEQEKWYLLQQLEAFRGKIGLTARSSGVDVKTLYRKMRLYGIDKRDFLGRASDAFSSDNKNSMDDPVDDSVDDKNPSSTGSRDL